MAEARDMTDNTTDVPHPDDPVRIALVGCGSRSRTVYLPLLESLDPWVRVVAVCDPVREHRERFAAQLDVPAYADLRSLIAERPMEAALVITPPATHYALVTALLRAGVHCHVETPFADTIAQCRRMVETARERRVTLTVTENFPRMPIDRFSQTLRDDGYIGPIQRVFSYNANANYHNNARWIAFARTHPLWVQAVGHDLPHPTFRSEGGPTQTEHYRSRFFQFPDNLLITDHKSNNKSPLGRTDRPGYEEFHGPLGTLLHRVKPGCPYEGEAFVHQWNPRDDTERDTAVEVLRDETGCWAGWRAATPDRTIAYHNPLRTDARIGWTHGDYWYGVAVMAHMVDFANSVRGLSEPEFTAADAAMAVMMERAAEVSDREAGRRVTMPLPEDNPVDAELLAADQRRLGADPLDVEAVLDASFGTEGATR